MFIFFAPEEMIQGLTACGSARFIVTGIVNTGTLKLKKVTAEILYCFRNNFNAEGLINKPKDNKDISDLLMHWFTDGSVAADISALFLDQINRFKSIHTNCLHVAIAGGLLGKTVYLYPNGYNKNRSVNDRSLKNTFKNIIWKDKFP